MIAYPKISYCEQPANQILIQPYRDFGRNFSIKNRRLNKGWITFSHFLLKERSSATSCVSISPIINII